MGSGTSDIINCNGQDCSRKFQGNNADDPKCADANTEDERCKDIVKF